jgi:hypothetical protein
MRARAVVLVLWWVAALAGLGCGTTTANLREWGSVYVPTQTTAIGAFVAAEWVDAHSSAEGVQLRAAEEVGAGTEGANVEGRRPVRRRGGGGEPGRRQPPLLNPRPTPEQRQAQERRAAEMAVVLRARQLYFQRLKEAQERYPESEGYHNHHFVPKYLGGPENGRTFRIPVAYHKAITREFRRQWEHGNPKGKPSPAQLQQILVEVYSAYPIPQLVGIEP